jgi:LysM repeat protein
MRKFSKLRPSGLLVTAAVLALSTAATGQDQAHEDKFKPRVYGSMASPVSQSYQTETERKEAARALAETIRIAQSVPEGSEMTTVIYDGQVYTSSHDANPSDYNRLMQEAENIRIYQGRNTQAAPYGQAVPFPTAPVTQTQLEEIQLFEQNQTVLATNTSSPTSISHPIVKGDTLYNLSKRYNVSMNDIRSANNIYGNDITIGEMIYIPVPQPSNSAPFHSGATQQPYVLREPKVRNVGVDTDFIYAVLPKDTLYSISRTTCTNVKDLAAVNGIEDLDSLKPGQRLSLPTNHCLTR